MISASVCRLSETKENSSAVIVRRPSYVWRVGIPTNLPNLFGGVLDCVCYIEQGKRELSCTRADGDGRRNDANDFGHLSG